MEKIQDSQPGKLEKSFMLSYFWLPSLSKRIEETINPITKKSPIEDSAGYFCVVGIYTIAAYVALYLLSK